MGVAGLIALLSLAFLLRPHRRRAMFGSGDMDHRAHRKTQPVNYEDQAFLKKSRAMIRGGSLTDSGNSFPGAEQFRSSHGSSQSNGERMLGYSDLAQSRAFDPHGSFSRGNQHPLNSSEPDPRRVSFPNGSPHASPHNSFTRGNQSPLRSSGNNLRSSGNIGPPPTGMGGQRNSMPPQMRSSVVPGPGQRQMSMPPVQGGGPPLMGQSMRQSMVPTGPPTGPPMRQSMAQRQASQSMMMPQRQPSQSMMPPRQPSGGSGPGIAGRGGPGRGGPIRFHSVRY